MSLIELAARGTLMLVVDGERSNGGACMHACVAPHFVERQKITSHARTVQNILLRECNRLGLVYC